METPTITCPNCRMAIPLNAAIEGPIVERVRARFAAESSRKESEFQKREEQLKEKEEQLNRAKASIAEQVNAALVEERRKITTEQEKKAREAVTVQLTALQQQIAEKELKLKQSQQAQLAALEQRRKLEEEKAAFELDKVKQIEAEREKIRDEAKKAATEAANHELLDLQAALKARDERLKQAEEAERKLREERARLEADRKAFELEVARKVDSAMDEVRKTKDEEYRLKEAEFHKKHEEMNRQIDELKRKAEQGSQQTQGEVLELDLENQLRQCFSQDAITPVPKGIHGGDVIQEVRNTSGQPCGTILWESKRTKTWSEGWIEKLKQDQLAGKAQIAVIVTTAMPRDVSTFECRDNIWVVPPQLAIPLATALRVTLLETATARRAMDGRHTKIETVYAYLSGTEFKARVGAIVEAFSTMQSDLQDEKRSILKLWAKREKQLERVLTQTAGLHGDLAGIIGADLPAIESLELKALAGDDGTAPAAADGTTRQPSLLKS